jgi:hypothetical protein
LDIRRRACGFEELSAFLGATMTEMWGWQLHEAVLIPGFEELVAKPDAADSPARSVELPPLMGALEWALCLCQRVDQSPPGL